MRAISIRIKILAIVLGFFTLIAAAFAVYAAITTQHYRQLRTNEVIKTVAFESERVGKAIAEVELGSIQYAVGGMLCFDAQSEELGKELVVEYLRGFPTAVGGGIWYAPYAFSQERLRAGFYAFYDKREGRARLDDTFLIDEYDYHSMSWYTEITGAIDAPYQVAWTKPYLDDSDIPILMITAGSCAFDGEGELLVMSTVDWEIEEVVMRLSMVKPTENSFVLLASPKDDYIISITKPAQEAWDSETGQTGASLQALPWYSHLQYAHDGAVNMGGFTDNGMDYLSFSRVFDNGWLFSVQIPAQEIFLEIETLSNRFTAIITGSFFILLALTAYLLSRLINHPLRRLMSGVARLGTGNLDMQIEVPSKDELGSLAAVLNKMTVDLKQSIEENARVLAEKERIGAELDVARRIQASMLPCIFPPFPGRQEFDIYASMEPAVEVGGDFYDFFFVDNDTLAVVIADVSGKGVPAALFMVIAKTLIKNNAEAGKSPKEVFEAVNNILCENNDTGMFVTAFMGYLHIPSGKFAFVNAGHNPPLIKQLKMENGRLKNNAGDEESEFAPGTRSYDWLKVKPEFFLAFMEDSSYTQHEVILAPGDEIFLYTDGVTEAMTGEHEMFSERRLQEAANQFTSLPLREFTTSIKREIDIFAENATQSDDITMLVLRYIGI